VQPGTQAVDLGTPMPEIPRALMLFTIAAFCEIGGGWLVWQWLREDRPFPVGVIGALVLVTYGVVHTLQSEAEFGRIYAAYGGLFIAIAMGWGMMIDGWRPDRWDVAGALAVVAGALLIMFAPRGN
jgi:small multidrug resistance family-3 protein